MGFGSYDESEQQNHDVSTEREESEGVDAHEHDHDGELTFESGSSVNDLVNRLEEIKATSENEE
ncbi:DUF5786 family protein [Halegenticoccus soli]|uniref:DUF5786 family protein n=1 Tax=Halegenticoccus soli TaxID=1985678 RepID=UPI000C6ECA35|nr:DUF5786 family protein [Halegenticoccus soli]